MIVQLAPIRSTDLQTGDVLIDRHGYRYILEQRAVTGWQSHFQHSRWLPHYIPDVDIDRTGPDRHWWLDQAVDR